MLDQSVVTVPKGPVFAANSTNASIVLWADSMPIQTTAGTYPVNYCDLLTEVSGVMGAGGTNGLQFNVKNGLLQLGYDWDNNSATTYNFVSGLAIPTNSWAMYGLVISPSNAVLYLCATNGIQAVTNSFANSNVPWGEGFQIGGALVWLRRDF